MTIKLANNQYDGDGIRIDLPIVPFEDIAKVKKLGGKWDDVAKIWYVRNPYNITLFTKWISPKLYYGMKSSDKKYKSELGSPFGPKMTKKIKKKEK